jgi:transcriptional regulator with XRE-family HTH domain
MEKSFLSLKRPGAKEAYVEAELVNGLAHQIRILREQRGWTQKELAKRVNTSQNTISRLEDPSYGRYTIRTLLSLSKAFDVALFVRYLPFSKFMEATWDTRHERFEAASYEEELPSVQFFTENKGGENTAEVYSLSEDKLAPEIGCFTPSNSVMVISTQELYPL